MLEQVGRVIDTIASSAEVQGGLRTAWQTFQQSDSQDDQRKRQKRLQGEIEQAERRLVTAGEKWLDGKMTDREYRIMADKIEAAGRSARDELAKADREARRAPKLPSIDAVLGSLGGWAGVLAGADVVAQRETLGALVERVVPIRERRGVYSADITWTPLGQMLQPAAI